MTPFIKPKRPRPFDFLFYCGQPYVKFRSASMIFLNSVVEFSTPATLYRP